jgi:hypothetical protein
MNFNPLSGVDRLLEALTDPKRRERSAFRVVVGYAALWTMHYETVELIAWSPDLAFGDLKQQPGEPAHHHRHRPQLFRLPG